jgi:hypothetical protein
MHCKFRGVYISLSLGFGKKNHPCNFYMRALRAATVDSLLGLVFTFFLGFLSCMDCSSHDTSCYVSEQRWYDVLF